MSALREGGPRPSVPPAFERALRDGGGWGLTRADGVVVAATLVLAAALCCVLWFGFGVRGVPGLGAPADSEAGGLVAVVQTSDGFYQVLPMGEDATLTVEGTRGTNVIEVKDGRVRCVESDCGNQVCVQTGWVGSAGEMVVCLPHRLTVQVVADEHDAVPLV